MCQHPRNPCSSRRQTTNQKPTLLRQSPMKKLAYLAEYLAGREKLDEFELGMQSLGTRLWMATM
jgi:hypothetical protein